MNFQKTKSSIFLGIILGVLSLGILVNLGLNYFHPRTLHISNDAPSYNILESMTMDAEYIVTGTYTSFEGKWNMSRNPDDIRQEANDSYVEGRLYNFQIESVLKGDLSESNIRVNLRCKDQVSFDGDSFFVTNPNYIEPELNQTYLLFLTKEQSPAFDGYYGTGTPFAIKLDDTGNARLEMNQIPDSGKIVQEAETSAGARVIIETDLEEPLKDFISGMSGDEVLKQLQNILKQN